MKSKTKFDPKAIQQFFIDHTEKFVVGLVAALLLFFAYQSWTLTGYATSPNALKSDTDRAKANIENGKGTKKPENSLDFRPYAEIIDGARKTIDPMAFPMPPRFFYRPIAPRRPREVPEVFAVEQLRAIPGRGAVPAAQGAAGNANTAGKRWILVTGLVPYKRQLAEYRLRFEGAAWNDPHEDVPKYFGYLVQRAEVVPGSEPKWSKSMIFPPFDAKEAAKLGQQMAEEIADTRFVFSSLTSPMPQLSDATWSSEAVSPPQIPVAERKVDNAEGTPDGAAPLRQPPRRPGKPGGRVRDTGRAGDAGMGDNAPAAGGHGLIVGWGDAGGAPDAPKPGAEKAKTSDEEADYRLLRFFDFDIKPNKQYQYRVFLILKNPNHEPGLDANVLEDPESAVQPFLGVIGPRPVKNADGNIIWPTDPKGKWSEPCTASRVPGDMRLLAGSVATKPPQEISAEVRVLLWQEKSGLSGNFSKPGVIRGTILNFDQAALRTPGGTRTTAEALATNCILVDLAGGDDRERRLTVPGMILVMDEFGNLVLHDEVAESEEWDKATTQPAPPPVPGPGRGHRTGPPDKDDDDPLKGAGADRHAQPPRKSGGSH